MVSSSPSLSASTSQTIHFYISPICTRKVEKPILFTHNMMMLNGGLTTVVGLPNEGQMNYVVLMWFGSKDLATI